MTARLDRDALRGLLGSLVAVEHALADDYQRASQSCDDPDLAVSLTSAGREAARRSAGVSALMSDLGIDGSAGQMPAPVAAALNATATRGDERWERFEDMRGLLQAEYWRLTAVDSLRAAATVTHDTRLASTVDVLNEETGARITWLRGLAACFAAGVLAPQTPGTPLPAHPHLTQGEPPAGALHGEEFMRGPNATPV